MIIDLDEELRLSRFRKIISLIKTRKVIKVSFNGRYYDITKIIDKKGMTIFEIGDLK